MDIIVCVKQVPAFADVRLDDATSHLIRQGAESVLNPLDRHALEAALQLRCGGRVTAVSMGPGQAELVLKECLAMGADEAVLLSDPAFGGADTLATSYTLATAIQQLNRFDLIICGDQSSDGDTGQVGPQLAERLGVVQVTGVQAVLALSGQTIRVRRELETGCEIVDAALPALLTVVKTINQPRCPGVKSTIKAHYAAIRLMTAGDIAGATRKAGSRGSATRVRRIFAPPPRQRKTIMIRETTARQSVEVLMEILNEFTGVTDDV